MKTFLERIEKISKQDIRTCYQCAKCTAGCPVASFMDIPPHRINKYVILGREDIMKSNSAWICSTCYTCGTRCPNDIDTAKVFDALKLLIEREKIKIKDKKIKIFHKEFMSSISKFGRVYEAGMLLMLKLKTRDLFSDMAAGIKLFSKGKIGILPPKMKEKKLWRKLLKAGKEVE